MNPVFRLSRSVLVWAVAPLLLTGRGTAQTAVLPTKVMSLEDCIQVALEHNLDIKIQRYAPEIADFNVSISYAGYDPNFTFSGTSRTTVQAPLFLTAIGTFIPGSVSKPEVFSSGLNGLLPSGLTYSVNGNFANTPFQTLPAGAAGVNYSGGASVSLSQPLLKNFWIDPTRLQIALAKKQLKVSEQALRQQVMTSVTLVEQAYYNLIFARESIRVQQKALELADQLLAENKKRVEVGAMAPLDEKQAESQAATAQAALLVAQQTWRMQENSLKTLLSDNYGQWQNLNIEPNENLVAFPQTFNKADSWEKALTLRPDLLQMK
ncbi:MAG: TolC family protein, partial [Verrucomicrobia bacterium]|nr:TolC family protein [Verrucomicrobiota bacterium]